jgi:hypothetical protein
LKLIHQQQSSHEALRPIYLLCVFRDENLLLDYFIEYYRSLGVTHFIMIDNLSKDGGPEYLKSLKNINLLLYRASESYEKASMGTDWVNRLLKEHCIDQCCFTVDVDELFLFNTEKYASLNDLIDEMEATGANAVPVTLLDMYPKKTNDGYKKGNSFLAHSSYFDDINETYYEERGKVYKSFVFKLGGVRQRIFGTKACINKFSLFIYNFYPLGVAPGYHFFQTGGRVQLQSEKISLFQQACVLLHFKFLKPHLGDFFQTRVKESLSEEVTSDEAHRAASVWADENEQYRQLFSQEGAVNFYDHQYSKRLKEIGDLSNFFELEGF